MSIPLDRLYHYINSIAQEVSKDNIIIYRFYPHGSKNIEDLGPRLWTPWAEEVLKISMYCNDQEPLHYNLYQTPSRSIDHLRLLLISLGLVSTINNLKIGPSMYDHSLLLHSEKRSSNLLTYQDNRFVPVYYWSHALISLEWFRYAEHAKFGRQSQKTFLIYNRAWGGTREYRLRFAELLVKLGMQNHCKTSINPVEPELNIHYEAHEFKNPVWRPTTVLENYFPIGTAHSHYSADFDIEDYEATDIEVVLETLFDDGRLHLTEKSLRPIACGQPFILAGTHGSLEYLRSYGFKTFSDVWDESYDTMEDPEERLYTITNLMAQIANWGAPTRERKLSEARAIADYNKRHFFSQEFFNFVTNELTDNLKIAHTQLKLVNNFKTFIDRRQHWLTFKEVRDCLESPLDLTGPTTLEMNNAIAIAEDRYRLSLSANKN